MEKIMDNDENQRKLVTTDIEDWECKMTLIPGISVKESVIGRRQVDEVLRGLFAPQFITCLVLLHGFCHTAFYSLYVVVLLGNSNEKR